ncbi:hypothetical protein GL305_22900 [Nocardia seriolae]|uniref:hypothetical protein n=1 Tax=Nocardia seriolae TaxID=37332 RepID=UPI0012BC38E0|nr:hypothetical protein [Nocardia seriolae]MTJ63465.1 hypothetical protein [Nocardia seriolae]MTJ73785.1 hypothetical protein [Nocardia seriolae]MTJ88734.1 hypothetical protein [Nocardia seriolae]MTK32714.1 hypothetical protein [Nocardia seriolae]MTK41365.1 hypothetical protein [Nocardia seriolae]
MYRLWRLPVAFAAIFAGGAVGQATAMWRGIVVLLVILVGGIMFENKVLRRR